MESFLHAHQNYDYEELCDEIESLQREQDESIANFNSSIIQNYYIFHDDDLPSKEGFDPLMLSLILNSLSKVEKQIFFDEFDSNKFQPDIFFGEPVIIPFRMFFYQILIPLAVMKSSMRLPISNKWLVPILHY